MRTQTFVQPTQDNGNQLPKFNKTITIEVDVDDIHKRLQDTFPEDYKHKDILSHAIVGSAVEYGGIGFIFNALNGLPNEIDFKVGEFIVCKEIERIANVYDWTGDSKVYQDSKVLEIGECEIVEINVYARDKIKVKFVQDAFRKDATEEKTIWVSHKNCTQWANLAH